VFRRQSIFAFAAAVALVGAACDGSGGSAGQGGSGGCPTGPQPLFNVTIKAESGAVPSDTAVHVAWSAGEEPPFVLDDPATWKTSDQGAIVCDVERDAAPPTDMSALVCHLWTSGATEVTITAKDYAPYKNTLAPRESERCGGPIPTDVDVVLGRSVDAGTD
jgi:hypothetical protein